MEHFQRYISLFHHEKNPDQFLFYTISKGAKHQMSDDNVARFLKQYGIAAKSGCKLVPENIYPHMFRRTRAMHLYRAGMPLALLSEWLGHEDPETTLIYYGKQVIMESKDQNTLKL